MQAAQSAHLQPAGGRVRSESSLDLELGHHRPERHRQIDHPAPITPRRSFAIRYLLPLAHRYKHQDFTIPMVAEIVPAAGHRAAEYRRYAPRGWPALGGAMGSDTAKVPPPPAVSSYQIVPSIASTSFRQMKRPSPVPT